MFCMNRTTWAPISVLHYVVDMDLTSVWKSVFTFSFSTEIMDKGELNNVFESNPHCYFSMKYCGNWWHKEKSWILVHFKTIQEFPEWCWVVPSRIFPEFFPNCPEQQDQTYVVTFRSRQFRKWPPVPSRLVSKKKLGNADLYMCLILLLKSLNPLEVGGYGII